MLTFCCCILHNKIASSLSNILSFLIPSLSSFLILFFICSTFSLFPNEYQPSGSLNFNKLDDAYLQLTLNKLINYQQPMLIRAYAVSLNLFRVIDGLGTLVFFN